jgi:tetratricopeptide (TPR) repeat protein
MPTTYNGIGTHYYGKKSRQVRSGACRACGAQGQLESYDTRLWFVVLFIPVIPLGRKRIIDQCPVCRRHFAAPRDQFEVARQLNLSGAIQRYRSQPSPEGALEVHGQMLAFHQHDEAGEFRQTALEEQPQGAVLHAGFAAQLDQVGSLGEATPLFERALALRPDLPEARVGVAARRIFNGELGEARELLEFLLRPGAGQLYPLGPLEQLAQAYQKAGQHAEALEIFERLLTEFPSAGQIHGFRKLIRASEKAVGAPQSILPPRTFSLRGLFSAKQGTYAPWQRGLAWGGIVAVLVAIGMAAVNEYRRQHRTVYVMNDLSQPAQVSIDGAEPVAVASRTELQLAEGPHQVTVSGPLDEDFDLVMETGYFQRWTKDPIWVINVGGAAALALETLHYARNPRPSQYQLFIGEPSVYCPHVDYPFETPPNSISVDSHADEVVKTRLFRVDESVDAMFPYALANADLSAAFRFIESHLQGNPGKTEWLESYVTTAKSRGQRERAEKFLERGLWREPISIPWHRAYQTLGWSEDQEEALVSEYDARLKNNPDHAGLLYLRGRSGSDRAQSVEFFHRACEADPSLSWPWGALAFEAASRGEWEEARKLADKAHELKPDYSSLAPLRHVIRLAAGDLAELETEYRREVETASAHDGATALLRLCDVLAVQDRTEDAWGAFAAWEARPHVAGCTCNIVEICRYMVRHTLGEFTALEESMAKSPAVLGGSDYQLYAFLVMGRPAEVVENPALRSRLDAPQNALAVSLAFSLLDDEAQAETWREHACAMFDREGVNGRRAAALLRGSDPPTLERVDEITLSNQVRLLLLAALTRQFPQQKAELVPLLRRLNVSRFPPYHLVKKVVDSTP